MEVALTVLYRKDKRYTEERKPVAIPFKNDFERYIRYNKHEVFDDVLVILRGGTAVVSTVENVRRMTWMRNT